MTQSTDYFFHARPESGQGLHTQESGDAGLSSNMEHNFNDDYNKSALPVADKGSFVVPIPKGELVIFEGSGKTKIWSHSVVFGHVAGPKAESHTEEVTRAEKGFMNPPTIAVALPENSPEKETFKGLLRATPITEGQPDEGSCIMDTKMDNPAKPKHPPLVPRAVRNSNHHRKRTAGKNCKLYLLCWMAVVFIAHPVSGSFPGKCFTCMDKDKCPKLMTIFDTNDVRVYNRDLNQTFPGCSGISPPDPKRCVVCCESNTIIIIICSHDVGSLEVEDSDGKQILNSSISPVCEQQHANSHAPVGLIPSGVLFGVVLAVLVTYSCCQKNRIENGQQ